jgi:hypothetical protein
MKVAIIDSGIDLYKLYRSERHGYEAVWVQVEDLTYSAVASSDLVIIPAGTDNMLLWAKRECLRRFFDKGGWIFSFDGIFDGLFDGLKWSHTPTCYKTQEFRVCDTEYAHLLNGVPLDGLACKDGVKGWWSEGELIGERQIPLIIDNENRVIASLLPSSNGSGTLIATAAGRLPIFSSDECLASNIFFSNLLNFCERATCARSELPRETHVYVHSGNWSHRSFLASEAFGKHFSGVHWSCIDEAMLASATSIWIPWESNTRALKERWPLLEEAVHEGAALVIEDLRDHWLPGVHWHSRPVDSSWWREKRKLDIILSPEVSAVLPNLSRQSLCWHYHGVFDGPFDGIPLLTTGEGKNVLSLARPNDTRRGLILHSTLDATFEYGVGKIKETAEYINGVLEYVSRERFLERK